MCEIESNGLDYRKRVSGFAESRSTTMTGGEKGEKSFSGVVKVARIYEKYFENEIRISRRKSYGVRLRMISMKGKLESDEKSLPVSIKFLQSDSYMKNLTS